MNIRRSRRRQISQIWINLLATFFFPKFFIKFSRVTNRHLARINLLKNFLFPPIGFLATKSAPIGLSWGARRPLGRFCSQMPRRCTPRNKRRRPCHHNLSRKAASATAVARAHARRPCWFLMKNLRFPPIAKFALKNARLYGEIKQPIEGSKICWKICQVSSPPALATGTPSLV